MIFFIVITRIIISNYIQTPYESFYIAIFNVVGTFLPVFFVATLNQDVSEKYALLAASVVVMSCFVVLLNRLIWKRLYRLAESRYSLNV